MSQIFDLDDLDADEEEPKPKRTRFGDWELNWKNRTIRCGKHAYCIHHVTTQSDVVSWIYRMVDKPWATPELLRDMLLAIRALHGDPCNLPARDRG